MDEYSATSRTRVRRLPKRASYDKRVVHAILDQGIICHVGFTVDAQPYVIPTVYARADASLYVHGSAVSRMLGLLSQAVPVCITVTLLDGLVLARSVFNHSVNYRSVVIIGNARLVEDSAQKMQALRLITNHVVPGRWEKARAPNELELRQTSVLVLPLHEVSAKIRSGPPVDDAEDYALPVWGGVLPLETRLGAPISDGRVVAGVPGFDPALITRFVPTIKPLID
jgi:nitroimidazol reductase NimA-like FMN-containing flavoprotein (pyridoxamine 5'-phosphate oxidase superfamily)